MATASRNGTPIELERVMFEESRTKEYFDLHELQTMTGQPSTEFPCVDFKEKMDNGLDAAENAGRVPEIWIHCRIVGQSLYTSIADNGDGLSEEALAKILNFNTRTSNKAHFRSPTRGLQGNALKTNIGIPHALGSRKPLVIESLGKRHFVRPRINPAGDVFVEHQAIDMASRQGTKVLCSLPLKTCQGFSPHEWARNFSLFNPHAKVKIRVDAGTSKHAKTPLLKTASFYYRPTVSMEDGWKKYMPQDPTSPHWYDSKSLAKLIFGHINLVRRGDANKDITLRQFVMQFKGLSGSEKSKSVCSLLPEIERLTDFVKNPRAIEKLLRAMQNEAQVVRAAALGLVGEAHFHSLFDQWFGVVDYTRFWYEKVQVEIDNIPYGFEVAIAETRRPGKFLHGINFSPSFNDPFSHTQLCCEDIDGYGAGSFLRQAHAHPDLQKQQHTAVAIHFVTPNLVVLDKGKTRVQIPVELGRQIADALWRASKTLYKEEERRRKDAARQERADHQRRNAKKRNLPLTDFMDDVVPVAIEQATGGMYRVSTHTLFYSARPEFQKYTDRILESQYFEHQLLPPYLREHPEFVPRLYREPRGVLYEPHTGIEVPLGTREVEAYRFPDFRFDKILLIEKSGLWPIFKAAQLAELYDMAIIAGEGVATEACRVLFQTAERGNYQLFVLHDADPWGYNIARTLREETARMPGYSVDVCDLGLKLKYALDAGLQLENATRKKAYPKGLVLTDLERKHFDGEWVGKKSCLYRRIELNAFTAPKLIAYTKQQLKAHGLRGKVIPPAKQLPELLEPMVSEIVSGHVQVEILRLVSSHGIAREIAEKFLGSLPIGLATKWIKEGFRANPLASWDRVLRETIKGRLAERYSEINAAVLAQLRQVVEMDL